MKRKILLHSCCGPCSTAVIERLMKEYSVTVFFYNPNITDAKEYDKRLEAQKKVIYYIEKESCKSIGFIEGRYEPKDFYDASKEYEQEKEGGKRCEECFGIRLEETAKIAKKYGIEIFTTTLTVSPKKNVDIINSRGNIVSQKMGVDFLQENFKKKAGYQRSIELSKIIGIYRQNYCGCSYSQ